MSVLTPTLEARARHRPRSVQPLTLPLCLLGSAALVWAFALAAVDLDGLSDIGLVSALPASYFVAVGLLTSGFFLVLGRDQRPPWLLGAYLLAAVLFLHGVPGFVEGAVRFPTAWVHAGFTEHIMSTHATLPNLDARFSWPGFFSAFALIAEAGGVSPLWFARWSCGRRSSDEGRDAPGVPLVGLGRLRRAHRPGRGGGGGTSCWPGGTTASGPTGGGSASCSARSC